MKLPELSLKLPRFPRPVAISLGAMAVSALTFVILLPTLGLTRDQAIDENVEMQAQLASMTKDLTNVRQDHQYVIDNQSRYEALLQSDRLVPHTRRDAVRQIQQFALARGLTTLNYDFVAAGERSLAAAASQTKSEAFRVNVENITLRIGAPTDGLIYRFVSDVLQGLSGAAILGSVDIERAPKVTTEMLAQVSRGQESALVKGEVKLLWRTAQANDAAKKTP